MKPQEFVSLAFAMRTAAHEAHLRAPTYARHIALEEFYDGIVPLADAFAEVWMGLHDQKLARPDDPVLPAGEPQAFLREFLDDMTASFKPLCGGDPSLENIVADARALTARTLYKLKFLGA